MSRRKVVKPVKKKSDRLKYYLLTLLQALLGSLVVVCFFVFKMMASLRNGNAAGIETYTPGFNELKGDYYESPGYTRNMTNVTKDILRYIVIRQQLETNGEYDPEKIIYVGAFSHRNDPEGYTGPDAGYYLDDLLKWGQKSINHEAHVFFSWEEFNLFFGSGQKSSYEELFTAGESEDNGYSESIIISDDISANGEDGKKVVAYIDTIVNRYKTVEGKNLQEVVNNSEDYNILAACLEDTINDLMLNYEDYLKYKEYYDIDASNIKYSVSIPNGRTSLLFTNDSGIKKTSSEDYISNRMKSYGEYINLSPGELKYLTNTPVPYQEIDNSINSHYAYAYPHGSSIWIALDKSFPAEDMFSQNYTSYYTGVRIIPWVVSMGLLAVIGFVSLFVYLVLVQKQRYSGEGAKDNLSNFDSMPVELSIIFFGLLITVLIVGEGIILRSINGYVNDSLTYNFIPFTILLGIDLFTILAFIYGFIRRIICNNVFEGSLVLYFAPLYSRLSDKVKVISQNIYDDSGLIVKVIVGYILFLVVNLYLILDIVMGERSILSIVIILLFDIVVGFTIYRRNVERTKLIEGIKKISSGEYDFQFDAQTQHGINRQLANEINSIGKGIGKAVETSIKDEKLKADLITNVSHDIKTPLTSIINYVDLIKKEKVDNENVKKYLKIIDEKSQRLRQLTFDLVEASKISSGIITLELVQIDFVELLSQALGEFEDKFEEHKLIIVKNVPDEMVLIDADPRHIWRVMENLFNNICKYALEGTRVYVDLIVLDDGDGNKSMHISIKNVSKNELNIPSEELTERFIRGDVSRSTEGSGLGLSIAKSLTTALGGVFDIYLDGDLFKVTLSFPISE